jgi:hypothetical protein
MVLQGGFMRQVHVRSTFLHAMIAVCLGVSSLIGCSQTGVAQDTQLVTADQRIPAQTMDRVTPTGVIDQSNQTVYIEFLIAQPGRQRILVNAVQSSLKILTRQPGFVWSALHRSIDSDYVVAYTQFQNRETLNQALDSKGYQARVNGYSRFSSSRNIGQYQVASIDTVQGPNQLEVKTQHPYVVIIDRVSVPSEQYDALLARTIGNGGAFKAAPGFQAAAVLSVLPGENRTQIATYAHWNSVKDFFDTVGKSIGRTLNTMDELNKALAEFGGGSVITEYQAYEVVTVLRAIRK